MWALVTVDSLSTQHKWRGLAISGSPVSMPTARNGAPCAGALWRSCETRDLTVLARLWRSAAQAPRISRLR